MSACINDTDGDGNCAACARNPEAPCRVSARDAIHNRIHGAGYCDPPCGLCREVEALCDDFALELAELIQDPKRWERFALKENSMRVYMSTAKKVARIIELEVESHG